VKVEQMQEKSLVGHDFLLQWMKRMEQKLQIEIMKQKLQIEMLKLLEQFHYMEQLLLDHENLPV
jgi:hypothetical protein